ncbi:ImmA/IrrE family metallo-endopeptidase [Paucidesulfovibrio longus]|uniref:ImmA/IrrE family metallo-endopeptidase n=1 Tax=Paucidesulfovibrio longus TaxID=889 RepID=UPI00040F6109|nr:ImmA/IrrE family metallo-endopeptidase [Paucidesulfovibrio longus]
MQETAISLVEDLLQRAVFPDVKRRCFETLAYIKKCKFLAPYNAYLVMQQRKNPSVVLTAAQWEKFGRWVLPDVQPIVILKPFGPVSFVYDLKDTDGRSGLDLHPNLPTEEVIRQIFPWKSWAPGVEERYLRIVDAVLRAGASFCEVPMEPQQSGHVVLENKLDKFSEKERHLEGYCIEINSLHPIAVRLSGLIHELAHIYCNHLLNERKVEEEEVEAEAVSYVYCYRRGFRPFSEEYLASYLTGNWSMPAGFWDTVLTALKKVEKLEEPREEQEGLAPDDFMVFVGGYMGKSYRVSLEAGLLRYEVLGYGYHPENTQIVPVAAKNWERFWRACDKCGVWGWLPDYPNPGVADGTQWEVQIRTSFRAIRTRGDNAFPAVQDRDDCCGEDSAVFDRFLRAVSKLVGGLPFE